MDVDVVSERSIKARECSVTVVVPTYHEVENLRPLVMRISGALSKTKRPYEVIVVDDDSRDGTDQAVRELNDLGYPIRLITRVGERGLSSAVIRGFSEANGETLICMDADLSHPPEAIPRIVECLGEPGTDLVLGSRYAPGGSTDEQWSLLRRINSKIATALARPFTSVKDPMSGFFAIPKTVYEKSAPLNPIGYKIALELIVKCECCVIREIPIYFAHRQFGESKLSLTERLNYLRHLNRLWRFKYKKFLRSIQFCHWCGDLWRRLIGMFRTKRSPDG
jgi:dolichol-phosphate mannosyltransferase